MGQTCIDRLLTATFADGGRGPDKFDCYGLAMHIFMLYGYSLPDYNLSAYDPEGIARKYNDKEGFGDFFKQVAGKEIPVPALVVIRNHPTLVNHVGVYIGNGKFVHILEKVNVHTSRIDHPMWKNKIVGFYTLTLTERR